MDVLHTSPDPQPVIAERTAEIVAVLAANNAAMQTELEERRRQLAAQTAQIEALRAVCQRFSDGWSPTSLASQRGVLGWMRQEDHGSREFEEATDADLDALRLVFPQLLLIFPELRQAASDGLSVRG